MKYTKISHTEEIIELQNCYVKKIIIRANKKKRKGKKFASKNLSRILR